MKGLHVRELQKKYKIVPDKNWPHVVREECVLPVISEQHQEIVELARRVGGEGFVDYSRKDVEDLINSHASELNEEELTELISK